MPVDKEGPAVLPSFDSLPIANSAVAHETDGTTIPEDKEYADAAAAKADQDSASV